LIKDNYKKECDLFVENLPKVYEFLPYVKKAKLFTDMDKSLVYDLVITVDVAALDRMGDAQVFFDKAKQTINIDHHETNIGFAQENLIVGDASSAGEVIFTLAKDNGWKISYETALALYTAILTDTGAEVLTGSTRLKAGTAQKIVLNTLTTCAMTKTGRVYENMMINLSPSNIKLKERVIRITSQILSVSEKEAEEYLEKNDWNIKKAVEAAKQ